MIDLMMKTLRQARPMMVGIIGMSIVLTGVVMIAADPVFVLAGLAILATEFIWARHVHTSKSILARFRKLKGVKSDKQSR
jgi:hypothetical protein